MELYLHSPICLHGVQLKAQEGSLPCSQSPSPVSILSQINPVGKPEEKRPFGIYRSESNKLIHVFL
jgi:hypothetical protein